MEEQYIALGVVIILILILWIFLKKPKIKRSKDYFITEIFSTKEGEERKVEGYQGVYVLPDGQVRKSKIHPTPKRAEISARLMAEGLI